jgi:threonine dehydrogenase-like Zn-dependent dehydrogenase
MKALTFQGTNKVSVENVPDPTIQEPTDAIVRMTSTAICGSDLHLLDTLGMYLDSGDVLGHEPMGIVEAVGASVTHIKPGDRVVIPFNISCGTCWMCSRGFFAQCETTQVRDQGTGAALFGYTKLYGQVPGAQAEYLRVPQAHFGPIKVPDGPVDERFLFLSDVLPTSWQAVRYADVEPGCTVAVIGLGPIGQMSARIAKYLGAERVIAVDSVPERLALAQRHGIEVIDESSTDDVAGAIFDLTNGRGADGVVEAVGMEAHGSPVQEFAQRSAGLLPDKVARKAIEKIGVDRMAALYTAFASVRRAGTVSILRQGRHHPHGTGPRQALDRRDHAGPDHRRRPAGHGGPHHAPAAPRRRPARLRDLQAEAGRMHQGGAEALSRFSDGRARPRRLR